ncbi:unnamed protein product, partial [Ectocarpus sp. 12 AP-2014]
HVGPGGVRQHPQVPSVPVDRQRGGSFDCVHRGSLRQGPPPQPPHDALGQPHHGHHGRLGVGYGGTDACAAGPPPLQAERPAHQQ